MTIAYTIQSGTKIRLHREEEKKTYDNEEKTDCLFLSHECTHTAERRYRKSAAVSLMQPIWANIRQNNGSFERCSTLILESDGVLFLGEHPRTVAALSLVVP